jgi:hypothetical protein
VDELLATDFLTHEILNLTTSHRELYKRAVIETHKAFPDRTLLKEYIITEGDRVAARWRVRVPGSWKASLHPPAIGWWFEASPWRV